MVEQRPFKPLVKGSSPFALIKSPLNEEIFLFNEAFCNLIVRRYISNELKTIILIITGSDVASVEF
jgi:hypothetical protein